ncbi:MAG: hypothetical protein ABI162_06395 [Luteolibacter sp.]
MNSDFDAIFKVTRTCDDEIAGFAAAPLTDVEQGRIQSLVAGERNLASLDQLAPMLRDNSTALEFLAQLLRGADRVRS